VGLVLGDRVEHPPEIAGDADSASGVVRPNGVDLLQISQGAIAERAVLLLEGLRQLVGVGVRENRRRSFDGQLLAGKLAKLLDGAVEPLILQVDQLGQSLQVGFVAAGMPPAEATAILGSLARPLAGDEPALVSADPAEVGEVETEAGGTVVGGEGVDVAEDRVAGDHVLAKAQTGGRDDAGTVVLDEDVIEGGILAQVFKDPDQPFVLEGDVALGVDAYGLVRVGADDRHVGGHRGVGVLGMDDLQRTLFDGEVGTSQGESLTRETFSGTPATPALRAGA
jgi:hypothetical protein